MWRGHTLDLNLEMLLIKCLKKLSHRAAEAIDTVLTELITENRTLGVECFSKIKSEK